MAKQVVTVRLDESVVEELDAEVEALGYGSRADLFRYLVSNRHDIIGEETLVTRVDALESRVSALERALADIEAEEEEGGTDGGTDTPAANTADALESDAIEGDGTNNPGAAE